LSCEDERGRCPCEKVVGDAEYAERRARSVGRSRSRQRLSLLQLPLAQYDDRAASGANRACAELLGDRGADSAHDDERGADSARNDPRRDDHLHSYTHGYSISYIFSLVKGH
jgi:hypothetical protein